MQKKKKVWIIQDKWRWEEIVGFETKKDATVWLREYLAVNTMKDKSDFIGPVKIDL